MNRSTDTLRRSRPASRVLIWNVVFRPLLIVASLLPLYAAAVWAIGFVLS